MRVWRILFCALWLQASIKEKARRDYPAGFVRYVVAWLSGF